MILTMIWWWRWLYVNDIADSYTDDVVTMIVTLMRKMYLMVMGLCDNIKLQKKRRLKEVSYVHVSLFPNPVTLLDQTNNSMKGPVSPRSLQSQLSQVAHKQRWRIQRKTDYQKCRHSNCNAKRIVPNMILMRLNFQFSFDQNSPAEAQAIAARAVAMVVNSSRRGIVPLCADVANLLRINQA